MSTSATPTSAPTSTPAIRSNAGDHDLLETLVQERAEDLEDDDHKQEHRDEGPGICLDVVRMDQRGDRVAQVGGGEARQKTPTALKTRRMKSVTPTQVMR